MLSIGCGSGVDARYLKDAGAKNVTGIDISEGLIKIAQAENPDIHFMTMDMEKLEFPDESFDVLYSSLAIHYLKDWSIALKEARRVLKPGGVYVFSCGHPLDSSLERYSDENGRGRRLGMYTPKSGERIFYGDYMSAADDGSRPITGLLKGIDVHAYHYPLSKMSEWITASGFSIIAIHEPLPAEEMKQKDPVHYAQLMKLPAFIIWVLEK